MTVTKTYIESEHYFADKRGKYWRVYSLMEKSLPFRRLKAYSNRKKEIIRILNALEY